MLPYPKDAKRLSRAEVDEAWMELMDLASERKQQRDYIANLVRFNEDLSREEA